MRYFLWKNDWRQRKTQIYFKHRQEKYNCKIWISAGEAKNTWILPWSSSKIFVKERHELLFMDTDRFY